MQMQDQELVFQEEEVVWAKIRGYPWWPAFVNTIHPLQNQENQYTVFFFGDNTNARLDGSKLRKFIQSYIEFYNKAKVNKKLMASILMAEENLKQNDQEVQIFEELRNKNKSKKGRGKKEEKDSVHNYRHIQVEAISNKKDSEHQIFEEEDEVEIPVKEKETRRGRKKKVDVQAANINTNSQVEKPQKFKGNTQIDQREEVQDAHKIQQQRDMVLQSKQSEIGSQLLIKRQSSIMRQVDITINIQSQKQNQKKSIEKEHETKQMEYIHTKRRRRQDKDKEVEVEIDSKEQSRGLLRLVKIKTDPVVTSEAAQKQIKEKKQSTMEVEQQLSNEIVKPKTMRRAASTSQDNGNTQRPFVQVRKRGRPKKTEIVKEQDESIDEQPNIHHQPQQKKKLIRKTQQLKPIQKPKMSVASQGVINGTQKFLNDRQGLINYLSRSTITVQNVKEILDMDVSNILQEGTITQKIIYVLDVLRAALLYKYFPDDVKHRKRYEKLIKKKYVEVEHEDRSQVETERVENEEIRRKTLQKIKKFLMGISEPDSKIIQISKRIEESIFRADNNLSKRYCRIAFLVLSALKDKRQTYQQVMGKLQSRLYD